MIRRAKTSEGLAARVEELIAPMIESMDYDIVRVRLGGDRRIVLQIMAERVDGAAMTVEDCADISRASAAILDVEDPISGAYELEVSSPGLDRPLTRLADFDRFAGFEAKVETSMLRDGRRRFSGRLLGVDGENVKLTVDGEEVVLPFDDIAKAKLVLTDELIAAHQETQ
ncbi:ribosome maturation factor RimP [Pelagibius sp. Alg239-R121]|uniref:ribosome maturation factor RimP n=1 Tax=Pelagibius sp. Alg239-R121 TaxID=2993448 RepID=UPI002AC3348B|nr:ribosome maturation factor RimP [Pelagibius sp. Alg239-R121]